jgi:hypothetical protein
MVKDRSDWRTSDNARMWARSQRATPEDRVTHPRASSLVSRNDSSQTALTPRFRSTCPRTKTLLQATSHSSDAAPYALSTRSQAEGWRRCTAVREITSGHRAKLPATVGVALEFSGAGWMPALAPTLCPHCRRNGRVGGMLAQSASPAPPPGTKLRGASDRRRECQRPDRRSAS